MQKLVSRHVFFLFEKAKMTCRWARREHWWWQQIGRAAAIDELEHLRGHVSKGLFFVSFLHWYISVSPKYGVPMLCDRLRIAERRHQRVICIQTRSVGQSQKVVLLYHWGDGCYSHLLMYTFIHEKKMKSLNKNKWTLKITNAWNERRLSP